MKIHPSVLISSGAKIGNNVEIGPFSQIHNNVVIGDDVKIGSYCELGIESNLADGSPLLIGNNSLIRSHSIFYESSRFESGLVTGHHVVAREGVLAGRSFQIGSFSELQGHTNVGNYVRFQSNIFVGKNTNIGDFVWLFPYVTLTNDPAPPSNLMIGPEIGDFVVIASNSIILPGITIGPGAVIGANSTVTKNVGSGLLAYGSPAKVIGPASNVLLKDDLNTPAYPWTSHFRRGYPPEIVSAWKKNDEF